MKPEPEITNNQPALEGIDFDKLSTVFKRNIFWVILIVVASNLTAYIYLRYTKDVFESASELKLDVKREATELGITNLVEDQNVNLVSGEIEQIKSKSFIGILVDSMDLRVSYFSVGQVLRDEMYLRSPFNVKIEKLNVAHYDQPIFIEFLDNDKFEINLEYQNEKIGGTWGKPVSFYGSEFLITKGLQFDLEDPNQYHFVCNSRNKLISSISTNLSVEPLNLSANTIRISIKDNNALKAFDLLSNLDSLYIKYSNLQKNQANKQKIDWLNRELKQIESRIEDYDQYFENFTLTNKSSDLGSELKKTITMINNADSQRYQLNKKIIEVNTFIDRLQSKDIANLRYEEDVPVYISNNLEQLQKTIQEKNKLSLAYNENTFAYRQKEQELITITDLVFKQLTDYKKNLLNTLAEVNKRKEKLEQDFVKMPDKNTEYAKNQRYYKLYEEFYLSMMQAKAEFEIAQAGSTPDFKILSSATLPTKPISPKKNLIYGIGFVGGIVLNIFFIGFLYLINNKIISLKELENGTRVPILGIIPVTNHETETIFHVIDNPKSVVSEAIRTLRTNLEFFSAESSTKVISISSTISGEGKSFLAVNLGGVIALSRKKVVLVDLDMRKPKDDKYPAGSDSKKGMSTILIKRNTWKECIVNTSLENFDFIPSGPHPPNPSELLANEEFSEFIKELRKHYDYIVIDTPPVGLVTDGIMAMKQSDISIYVFRASYSSKDYMHSFRRIVTLNKLKNVSSVLNAISIHSEGYGYGYYEDRTPIKKKWRSILKKA